MLALTMLVGASIFSSPPMDSRMHFYLFCIMVELAVILFAISYKSDAYKIIAYICAAMIVCHVAGFAFKGGLLLSPYRILIKIFECLQLLTCVAFSPIVLNFRRAKHATFL